MAGWKRIGIVILGLVVLVPAVAAAQGTATLKIAYVDSEAIVRQAPGYTEASEVFNRTAAGWRDTLEQKRLQLEEMLEEYKNQEAVLTDEKRAEKQQEMLRLEQEAQQFFQQKFGPEGEAQARQAELMGPILERVNRAIDDVRREEGYSLIFDLNADALVAGDPSLNITDQIIRRMNAQTSGSPSR